MTEISELLGVSRQRADQLSRTKGFPEAIRLVVPVVRETPKVLWDLWEEIGGSANAEQATAILEERAFELPETPRLWRREEIEAWAQVNGRELA
jgi:hypothetical protein